MMTGRPRKNCLYQIIPRGEIYQSRSALMKRLSTGIMTPRAVSMLGFRRPVPSNKEGSSQKLAIRMPSIPLTVMPNTIVCSCPFVKKLLIKVKRTYSV